jgi:Flp pilus assembly protein TadG
MNMMAHLRPDLRSRHGFSEALSTILSIPVLLVIVGMMIYFGRALYAKAAIEEAAAAGARFAATSLSGQQGCAQAQAAVIQALRGYYLDPNGAAVSIRPRTVWGRGAQALVDVSYHVGQSRVPIFGALLGPTHVQTGYVVRIDAYNNRYANGYLPCVWNGGGE